MVFLMEELQVGLKSKERGGGEKIGWRVFNAHSFSRMAKSLRLTGSFLAIQLS